jgi:hypothetical protein
MKSENSLLGDDELCVLNFLNTYGDSFVHEREIARRADCLKRFEDDPRWAASALINLFELDLVEMDHGGRYRLNMSRPKPDNRPRMFIAPEIRSILEHSPRHFDLSHYV